jgi:hypothetical protein
MKNQMVWGLFALFVVSIVALAGIAYAYRGNPSEKGPNYDAEVHEQLEAAIDAGDYDAWIRIRQDNNLPMNGRLFQVINKDNFDKYTELHDANLAGDTVKADAIKAELGLGQGMMKRGSGQGKMTGSGSGLQKNFVDANNDGLCDNCKKARN